MSEWSEFRSDPGRYVCGFIEDHLLAISVPVAAATAIVAFTFGGTKTPEQPAYTPVEDMASRDEIRLFMKTTAEAIINKARVGLQSNNGSDPYTNSTSSSIDASHPPVEYGVTVQRVNPSTNSTYNLSAKSDSLVNMFPNTSHLDSVEIAISKPGGTRTIQGWRLTEDDNNTADLSDDRFRLIVLDPNLPTGREEFTTHRLKNESPGVRSLTTQAYRWQLNHLTDDLFTTVS